MGLFTYVKPAKSVLPKPYSHLTGWQTKDVIQPSCETLEITEDGRLMHIQHRRTLLPPVEVVPRDWLFQPVQEQREVLDFHGDMKFYTAAEPDDKPPCKLIELVARFSDGKLQGIKDVTV